MTDHVTPLIHRLACAEADDLPDLFKALVRDRQMSKVMRRINADLLSADTALRDRASLVLSRLGFPH